MTVVLDNCIPSGFKPYLEGHFEVVKECREMGWDALANGKLLTEAQADFDVFVTVDSGNQFQQNLAKFDLGIVIAKVRRNTIEQLAPLTPKIVEAVEVVEPGQAILVT